MALVVKDRVKEITTTTGTSNLALGGAAFGFQSFAVIGDGNTTYYGIYDSTSGDWEVGIGTYTASGPTLSRDTVLESSNAGSKVVFGAGSKDVFVTYPAERSVYLSAAGLAVDVLDIGTLGTSTANISTANITAGTVSTTPTSSNDLVNKSYVDGIAAQGITYHQPVKYEVPNTTGNLNAIYNNGTGGVGATLTNNGTLASFAPDGPTAQVGDRILVYSQTNAFENGVYEVSTVGDGSTAWVLTRAADADSYGLKDPNSLGQGDAFYVTSGNTGAGETYVCNTAGTITFGTTAITFAQVSSAQVYSAGTGLTLSNLQFSITPVGTAGTYGSASQVPVFVTNASGQVTSVTNTGIAISSSAVSGLAPSATTDTTNASNITSGTLDTARLSGSYTGITGVGTLTAGTWTATAIGAAYGGTGLTSFTQGDLLYATSSTTLGTLADVVAGNALISGGVGSDPSWGKIGLQTHISGTLQVANGGTGATDASGARSNLGLAIGTDIPSVTGTGASGTWGINITGNAATATTATSATSATSVANSVTFNNSGAGAASGNGFNGSSALTVSYNTIGAPSTTGTNASGTWGISITGSAASATTATNIAGGSANQVPYQSGAGSTVFSSNLTFDGTTLTANALSVPTEALFSRTSTRTRKLVLYDASLGNNFQFYGFGVESSTLVSSIYSTGDAFRYYAGVGASTRNEVGSLTGTGIFTASADVRAPIFYDSNNTGYYIDPASTSEINKVYYNSNMVSRNYGIGQVGLYDSYRYQAVFAMGESYILPANGTGPGNLYGIAWSHPNAGGVAGNLASHGMLILENGGFRGAWGGGRLVTTSDIRGTIFYDYNDTGYYCDPNSSSQFSAVFANNWFRPQGTTGIYWQDYAYYFYKNPDVYANFRCGETPQNSYVGIQYYYGGSSRATTMFDSSGNGGLYNYAYWIYYWSPGNACLGVRTSSTSSSYAMYVEGGIYSTGNVVAYSDARKKTNIVTVDNALDTVDKLRGVYYNRVKSNDEKADPNKRQLGVIAQEVNEVLPEVVTYAADVDEYGVQYGNMAGLFIEAIKALRAEVKELRAMVQR